MDFMKQFLPFAKARYPDEDDELAVHMLLSDRRAAGLGALSRLRNPKPYHLYDGVLYRAGKYNEVSTGMIVHWMSAYADFNHEPNPPSLVELLKSRRAPNNERRCISRVRFDRMIKHESFPSESREQHDRDLLARHLRKMRRLLRDDIAHIFKEQCK